MLFSDLEAERRLRMFELIRYMKKPLERRVLIALWFNDHTVYSLAKKLRMDDLSLRQVLSTLQKADLITIDNRYHDLPVALDADFRYKVSMMMSRAIVSLTFLFVGFALTNFDRSFEKYQQKRIRHQLRQEIKS